MSWLFKILGASGVNQAEVTTDNRLKTDLETDAAANSAQVGAVKLFSEVDSGDYTGTIDLRSAEVDDDYRMRVAHDTLLDYDSFRYTAQNTGKHTITLTTMAATMTAAGITTNSGNITTINTGMTFGTHAMFPVHPTQTTVAETSVAFSAQPVSNTIVDFGLFQRGYCPA